MENPNDVFRHARFRCSQPEVPGLFYIVTAYHPEGVPEADEINRASDHRLLKEIERLGFDSFPVTGGNADFSHAEPGHGITCTRAEALRLAEGFRQLALFEVREGRVILVSATTEPRPDEPIGSWSELLSD